MKRPLSAFRSRIINETQSYNEMRSSAGITNEASLRTPGCGLSISASRYLVTAALDWPCIWL